MKILFYKLMKLFKKNHPNVEKSPAIPPILPRSSYNSAIKRQKEEKK